MLGKTKKFFFILFIAFLGLLYPAVSQAANFVLDIILGIAAMPFFYFLYVIVKVAVFIAGLSGSLLNWVLSPGFISYSYTNPGGPNGNPIIDAGLGVTRGFVNMLLVLVLVYIAIATILRLAGYETKKLLVTFIIVALLVNFAPVICGLIVDASNIIMNFFVQDLKADAFAVNMGTRVEQISFNFDEEINWRNWDYVLQLAIMVPFLYVLIFILGVFTLIFTLRYLVIWILVILSPLAFVCYILPVTKKYFDQWWQQFLAWSFIGVTCGFFLYLALLFVSKVPGSITPPTTGRGGVFDQILPFFVAVVFLGLGIVFGLKTSAMGASTVMGVAKTKGKATVRGAGRGAKWVGGRVWKKGIKPRVEKPLRQAGAGVIKGVEAISRGPLTPLRWFIPERLRKLTEARPSIDKAIKEADVYSSKNSGRMIATGAVQGSEGTGHLLSMLKRGDAQDLFNESKEIYGVKTDEELLKNPLFIKRVGRLINIANTGGYLNDVVRRSPRLAAIASRTRIGSYADIIKGAPEGTQEEKESWAANMATAKAADEARRSHINDWEREELENKTLIETLMTRGREPWMAIDTVVKRGVETATNTVDEVFTEWVNTNRKDLVETLNRAIDAGDKTLETQVSNMINGLWNTEFRRDFKTKHQDKDGLFLALETKTFRDRGWRAGQYKIEKEKKEYPSPIEVTIGFKKPPESPDTGEARRVKRKTPDTGG